MFATYHNSIRRFKSRGFLSSVKSVSYLSSKSQMLCCLCKGYSICPHRDGAVSKAPFCIIRHTTSGICMCTILVMD